MTSNPRPVIMGGSSPLPLSLQSKFQRARAGPLSRLRNYQSNFNMLVR